MAHFNIKYTNYDTDLQAVEMAVREEIEGPGQLLGYRSMHKKLQEQHNLAVPHGLVHDVMTLVDPEGLECRSNVGRKKCHHGPHWNFHIIGNIFHIPVHLNLI